MNRFPLLLLQLPPKGLDLSGPSGPGALFGLDGLGGLPGPQVDCLIADLLENLLPELQIRSGKLDRFPIVGMGGDFWQHLRNFARETMLGEGVISPEDLDFVRPASSPEEALELIRNAQGAQPDSRPGGSD